MSIDSTQGNAIAHDLSGKELFAAIESSEVSLLERLLKLDELSKHGSSWYKATLILKR